MWFDCRYGLLQYLVEGADIVVVHRLVKGHGTQAGGQLVELLQLVTVLVLGAQLQLMLQLLVLLEEAVLLLGLLEKHLLLLAKLLLLLLLLQGLLLLLLSWLLVAVGLE